MSHRYATEQRQRLFTNTLTHTRTTNTFTLLYIVQLQATLILPLSCQLKSFSFRDCLTVFLTEKLKVEGVEVYNYVVLFG